MARRSGRTRSAQVSARESAIETVTREVKLGETTHHTRLDDHPVDLTNRETCYRLIRAKTSDPHFERSCSSTPATKTTAETGATAPYSLIVDASPSTVQPGHPTPVLLDDPDLDIERDRTA